MHNVEGIISGQRKESHHTWSHLDNARAGPRLLSKVSSGFFLLQHVEFFCGFVLEKWTYKIAMLAVLLLKMTTQEKRICGPSALIVGAVNVGDTLLSLICA